MTRLSLSVACFFVAFFAKNKSTFGVNILILHQNGVIIRTSEERRNIMANKTKCPKCNKFISDKTKFCPHCTSPITNGNSTNAQTYSAMAKEEPPAQAMPTLSTLTSLYVTQPKNEPKETPEKEIKAPITEQMKEYNAVETANKQAYVPLNSNTSPVVQSEPQRPTYVQQPVVNQPATVEDDDIYIDEAEEEKPAVNYSPAPMKTYEEIRREFLNKNAVESVSDNKTVNIAPETKKPVYEAPATPQGYSNANTNVNPAVTTPKPTPEPTVLRQEPVTPIQEPVSPKQVTENEYIEADDEINEVNEYDDNEYDEAYEDNAYDENEQYDPNYDHYYDNVKPAMQAEIKSKTKEIILKSIGAVLGIAVIVYCMLLYVS